MKQVYKWIDATDLKAWATRLDSQETMPLLIRKLIRATATKIGKIKFPAGESVQLGGWDGILEVEEGTEFFPSGISLWESGTNRDIKGKADGDYEKRTKNPLGYVPAESTFIFVTPRLWQKGEEWAAAKLKEGIWKDVRVLNAEILEEWIDTAPTVSSWLAKHIGKYPQGGIQPTDDFWEEWSSGGKLNLNPDILLGGRTKQMQQITTAITNSNITAVQGISREEALAFIISCFKENAQIEEDFFARSIIVDNVEAFRELSVLTNPMILIPRFEDSGVMNRAVAKGHTVLVPLDTYNGANWQNKVVLPSIDRDSFVAALCKAGMSNELAQRYSKETVRNITILRRQLEFERMLPEWASPENVADLLPALIVGRWDETFEQDKMIVAEIAGDSYENYIKKLTRWLQVADAPIIKLGSSWRLTAPFDAWINASGRLSSTDFELLRKVARQILLEINPAFDLEPDKRYMAAIYGKKRSYSSWIREGVLHSLILTSIFGDKLNFSLPLSGELWVDGIIEELLHTEDAETWRSFEGLLPLIAEASPSSFLSIVEAHLRDEKPTIRGLFTEDPGFLTATSYHTGLLWALEELAWFPAYFSRAVLILARLSVIDPGGQLANRPFSSLIEIFKPWHYQTLAPLDERMAVLKLITQKIPDVGWRILINMLPGGRESAQPTHMTRWRAFDLVTDRKFTYKEIFDTYSAVTELLITLFDGSESKLSDLINHSVELSPQDKEKVLGMLKSRIAEIKQSDYSGWHALRGILSRHRSYRDTDWAMSEEELVPYQELYHLLTPTDEIEKALWMFNQSELEFPEGFDDMAGNYEEKAEMDVQTRRDALDEIHKKHTTEKIIALSRKVKEPWLMGDALARLNINDDDPALWAVLEQKDDANFIRSFVFRKHLLNGFQWVNPVFDVLKNGNYSDDALINFLLGLRLNQDVWDLVDQQNQNVIDGYWQQVTSNIFVDGQDAKIFAIKKLCKCRRFISAIQLASFSVADLPTSVIVELLEEAGTTESVETHLRDHHLNRLFDELDKRTDIAEDTIFRLEWLYLPVLAAYGSRRKPKKIHDELSKNPAFFMEVLTLIYKPADESKLDEVRSMYSPEQLAERARRARELLDSWKKIPGTGENGTVDYEFLNSWIDSLRTSAEQFGRIQVADVHIGKVLAQFPEQDNELWPPEGICQIIERIDSESLFGNFGTAIVNKRSMTSRGVFEGGDIERNRAAYFQKLSNAHRNCFPAITRIFERLVVRYLAEAKRHDEDAEKDRLDY